MQLEHSFTVPAGINDAWKVLLDIERIAPCMPGAAVDSVDGDNFTGTVKVKLGPIGLTYKGKASFVEKDETTHRAVINAQGRDARGNGTAAAKVSATLTEDGGRTKVDVVTDLDITGKPAQFGRGVMVDVGNKLIGQFADCLAGKLGGGDEPAAAAESTTTEAPGPAKKAPATKPAATKPAPAQPAATADTAVKAESGAKAEPGARDEPGAKAEPKVKTETAGNDGASEPATGTATTGTATTGTATTGTANRSTPAPAPSDEPNRPRPPVAARHSAPAEVEPINLLESAGPAVAKRLAPLAAVLLVVLLVILRRRRH